MGEKCIQGILKPALFEVGVFAGVLAICLLALVGVYSLPTDRIEANVLLSAEHFGDTYVSPMSEAPGSRIDGYTDALMLLEASNAGGEDRSVLDCALLNSYVWIEGVSPAETIAELSDGDDRNAVVMDYPRYWHGYLVALKPLLMVFDYGEIRNILMCVQTVLVTGLVVALDRRRHGWLIPSVLAFWLFLNPPIVALCMQYSAVTTISLVGMLVVALGGSAFRRLHPSTLFLVLGMLTSFFDLLTFPMLTLFAPLVLSLALEDGSNPLGRSAKATLVWGVGYAAMWVSKWVIASLVTNTDVVGMALEQAQHRAAGTVEGVAGADGAVSVTYVEVLLRQLSSTSLITVAFIAIVVSASLLVAWKNRGHWTVALRDPKRVSATLVLVGLSPFVWYAALQNHSYIHFWMTYRNLGVSILSWGVAATILASSAGEKAWRSKQAEL